MRRWSVRFQKFRIEAHCAHNHLILIIRMRIWSLARSAQSVKIFPARKCLTKSAKAGLGPRTSGVRPRPSATQRAASHSPYSVVIPSGRSREESAVEWAPVLPAKSRLLSLVGMTNPLKRGQRSEVRVYRFRSAVCAKRFASTLNSRGTCEMENASDRASFRHVQCNE